MFKNSYKNKKILVTGHTGFKGSWLSSWLLKLGAEVVGVSMDVPTNPSMFKELSLESKIKNVQLDIRNISEVNALIEYEKPDFIFHLAAQAIVSTSYSDPLSTVTSNVVGTTNILESLRTCNQKCTAVIITSDKAYDNVEQIWGYKENDAMGGKDIYSGSKGAAELIIKSYYNSFFKLDDSNVRISIARAGNVIGGGDWAKDRIVVDAITAWSQGKKVAIRNPNATRPWQHVLEPLSGYLSLGEKLNSNNELNGEAFNFGPKAEQNRTVRELLEISCQYWNLQPNEAIKITNAIEFHEASLLKLNCDKALAYLNWNACLDYDQTISFTNKWYCDYYKNKDMSKKTLEQISEYEKIAFKKKLEWTE